MGYTEEKRQHEKELKMQTEATRVAEAFAQFFAANRDILNCQANEKLLREFFGDDTREITLQALNDAVNHTLVSQQLAKQTEYVEREKLVNYIVANRQMQPDTEKHERARLMNEKLTAIETVRTIAENVRKKKELSQLAKNELRTLARGPQQSQFMPVPPIYRTKIMLLDLANTDLPAFKRLTQKCGKQAIDAILQTPEEG